VLVSDALSVSKNGISFNTVTRPGALVGEISVLLGVPCGATVRATTPSVLRHTPHGRALLDGHPSISRLVALGLAERLNHVTTCLVDLQAQYGSATGLAMVPDVLRERSRRQSPPARPGSARDPDPAY
jgi:CRP-like cAMP-binding protein